MTKNLTVEGLKAWSRENHDLAIAVLKTQAFAQLERERVDAYIHPLFLTYGFTDEDGEPITDEKRLYNSTDEARCTEFYAACDVAHREHGYKADDGSCPALAAEWLQLKAENTLLESLATFTGVDDYCRTLEIRAKALDLALGVAVKVPS